MSHPHAHLREAILPGEDQVFRSTLVRLGDVASPKAMLKGGFAMRMSELFLRAVKKYGVNTCYGIVGGEAEAIQFPDHNDFPEFFLTRHEFTAGVAAEVSGRLAGIPSMCWVTYAPGLTNAATGLCSAILDRSPSLFASAQVPSPQINFNITHQCIDNVKFAGTLAKSAVEVRNLQDLATHLPAILGTAVSGLPGPVYISLPLDFLKSEISDTEALEFLASCHPSPTTTERDADRNMLRAVAGEIDASKYPLIVIGNQPIRHQAVKQVRDFVDRIQAPVICSLAAKGVVPETHPLFLTAANKYLDGVYNDDIIKPLFEETDLLVLIGYDYGEDLKPSLWEDGKRTVVLNSVDVPCENIFNPNVKCIGDLDTTLTYLTTTVARRAGLSPTHKHLKSVLDRRGLGGTSHGLTDVPAIVSTISEALGEDGFLCSDVGLHKQYAGLLARTVKPNHFLCSNVCGSFGFGLPAAIATQVNNPDSRVAVICGDGGFHSGSQDLETVVRYNLPIVTVVLNDSSFGLIRYYESLSGVPHATNLTEFGRVDFSLLAKANGMHAEVITDESGLAATLERAFGCNRPCLIEVPTQYSYRMKQHIA
jgi:N2-(2-carboxyethyl)arginine synthase